MAVLAPAVLVSRIATRDTGSICFFALGLWAFAVAWGKNRKRDWILAALFFFAGFLCKYLIALYFPLLVILSLGKGKKPGFLFAAPLFAACAIYGVLHFADLSHLLRYGSSYGSLRAPGNQAWSIYGWDRGDFWLLVLPAVSVIFSRTWRTRALWLWAGAVIMLLFQWKSRADYDYWKHVNYSFLFLVPLAVAGVVFLALALQKQSHFGQMLGGICGVLALVAGTGWMGREQSAERFMFWPNVTPIVAYFENTLAPTDRVLVDDTVFRYYFQPVLHQPQITDPMYFRYKGREGVEAYQSATQDGVFSYIVLDGGIGEEARRMDAAVHSQLSGYQLQLMAADPTMGQNIEIYAKAKPPGSVAAKESDVRVLTPASNTVVSVTTGSATVAEGVATGAHPGWYIRMEVFTDRWYAQGDRIEIAPGGSFRQEIYLAGEHRQQCFHILRTRLFDQADSVRAVSFNYGIARANPDGSIPACRPTLELNQPNSAYLAISGVGGDQLLYGRRPTVRSLFNNRSAL